MRSKTIAFDVFCSLIFDFVGWFWLIYVFVCSKSYRKKKKNRFEIVLIASIHTTTNRFEVT